MSPMNPLPLRNRLLRALAGVRRETAGSKSFAACAHATRSCCVIKPPREPLGCPSRPLGHRRPTSGSSDGFTAFASSERCRHSFGWRLFSTRKSEGEADGGDTGSVSCTSRTCWKCSSTLSWKEYFCECGAAQALDGRLNYFELLSCPPSVFVELKEIEKRFKNLQRTFHPDLFTNKCEKEQEISAANSAVTNKAYQTLVQPMARVKHLMRVLGSTALEEDERTPVPMDFLMEVMETRESLEQCSSQAEVEAILAETRDAIDECLSDMDKVLKAGGGKDEISDAAVRLKYLYRIEDEARRVSHRLEDSAMNSDTG